jgi:ParB family chromosome partitioning protein
MENKELLLNEIVLSLTNPRKKMDVERLKELADSIKKQGVIEPIIVRPIEISFPDSKETVSHFEVVCGARRFEAAKIAGLNKMPTIIMSLTNEQASELCLIENLQREDMNPIDEAQGIYNLLHGNGKNQITREDSANKIGKSVNYVSTRMELLSLPKNIQNGIAGEKITAGHGAVLLRVNDPKEQTELFDLIIREKLSIRSAENKLRGYGRSLAEAPFDKKICLGCPANGTRQVGLFDKETDLKGRCLDSVCFTKKMDEFITSRIAELQKAGSKVITKAKLIQKLNDNYPPYKDLGHRSYCGDPAKKRTNKDELGKAYKEKCAGCEKRTYVIIEGEKYGDEKGIRKIEEWCLNPRCFTLLCNGPTKSAGPEKRLERSTEQHVREAKVRFWKSEIVKALDSSPATVVKGAEAALCLYGLLANLSVGDAIDEILPKTAIRKVDYGSNDTSVKLIHALGQKEIDLAIKKAARQFAVTCLNDKDLEFTCAALGTSLAKDFVIDREYLQPKTKDQLVQLAKEIGLDKYLNSLPEVRASKLIDEKKSDLIDLFLTIGFDLKGKVPKEIAGKNGTKTEGAK